MALNKSALHYIIPPAATDSTENKNLYPVVVNAFQINHIALTSNKKDAAFLVTWGTQDQSKQIRTLQAVPTSSYPGLNNVNAYDYYGYGAYGQSPTGPTYIPVMRSYHMQNFTISIWRNEGAQKPVLAWNGSATAGAGDVKDPAPIIDDIVARYGTTFEGDTQIKNN